MNKPKVLVCCLTGSERTHWLNSALVENLIAMSHDRRFDVQIEMIRDLRPFEYARNYCVATARARDVDFLLMLDNDNACVGFSPLDVLTIAGDRHIIGIPYCFPGHTPEGNLALGKSVDVGGPVRLEGSFFPVKAIGTGCMFLHRTVWEQMGRGPWFQWKHTPDDELCCGEMGEDFAFCEKARAAGLQVWAFNRFIPHFKSADVTEIAFVMEQMQSVQSRK